MKKQASNNIEVRVIPYGDPERHNPAWTVEWRDKWKRFNFLNDFKGLYEPVEYFNGIRYNHPYLSFDFNEAIKFAKSLKENPDLIRQHYEFYDEVYRKMIKDRETRKNKNNKEFYL